MLDSTILRLERIDERWTMVAVTFDVAPDPVREAIRGVVLRAIERQRTSDTAGRTAPPSPSHPGVSQGTELLRSCDARARSACLRR